jgi:alpha-tubulin suppressor-like RCC1 family protein
MRFLQRVLTAFIAILLLGTALSVVAATPLTSTVAADSGETAPGVPSAKAAVITAGFQHTCVITGNGGAAGGDVRCWGDNANGQLGQGDTSDRGDTAGELATMPPVSLGAPAIALSAGKLHTCAILVGGSVKCWGHNSYGQLGIGSSTTKGDNAGEMGASLPAVDLGAGRTATMITAGWFFTCARLDNGDVKCWGDNSSGQLGQGDTANRGDAPGEMAALAPINFGNGAVISSLSAGAYHVCATGLGSLYCWGENSSGQLGLNDSNDRGDQPGEVATAKPPLGATVQLVASGRDHTCVSIGLQVKCWGDNTSGQLGKATVGSDIGDQAGEISVALPGMSMFDPAETITALTAMDEGTCAMGVSKVMCWGDNFRGQLGRDSTTDLGGPTFTPNTINPWLVAGTPTAIAGGGSHICAAMTTREVRCLGSNTQGQLGLGHQLDQGDQAGESAALSVVPLRTQTTASALAVGSAHGCAVLTGGTLKCWGASGSGQLGYGDTQTRGDGPGEMGANLPTVQLGTGVQAFRVVAGNATTCVITTTSTLKCWGDNEYGQLGRGDTSNRGDGPNEMGSNLPAINLGSGRTVVDVSIGQNHVCAVLDNGSVKCWGDNTFGQLGVGDTADRGDGPNEMGDSLPAVSLGAGRSAVQVAAGPYVSCALLDNATVKCWGYSPRLGLGLATGSTGDSAGEMGDSLPALNLGTGRTANMIGSGNAMCARLDNFSMKCWGDNSYGGAGTGTTDLLVGDTTGETGDGLLPVALGTGRTVTGLSNGQSNTTCALLNAGGLKCWGLNSSFGNLGLDDRVDRGDGPGEMGDNLPNVKLPAGYVPAEVDASGAATCVRTTDGRIVCFGTNNNGTLGTGVGGEIGSMPGSMATLQALDLGDTPFLLLEAAVVASPPSPPNNVAVTAGLGSLNVTWTAPTSDNGAVISGYRLQTSTSANGVLTEVVANTNSTATSIVLTNVQPGVAVWVSVSALNAAGEGQREQAASAVAPMVAPYVPLTPFRLADTRTNGVTGDGQGQGGGPVGTAQTLTVQVTGRGNVPAGAKAAALNVTAVGPGAKGYATVYPCDVTRPLASNLNFAAGVTTANAVFADLSATGTVCVFVSQATNLIVDVNGAYPQSSSFAPLTPFRLLDNRAAGVTGDGQQQGPTNIIPITVNVAGRGGVAEWARTVTLNVTVTGAAGKGFATVYPCDVARPLASNLNYGVGQTVANAVTTKLSATGTVCVFLSEVANVIVDVNGAAPATGSYTPLTPFRLSDTRSNGVTGDGQGQATGVVAANGVLTVQVEGRGGVLGTATAAMLNVTVIGPAAKGFATVYPCDVTRPTASTLNFEAGATVPNATLTKTSATGTICVFVSQAANVIVDVSGFEHP